MSESVIKVHKTGYGYSIDSPVEVCGVMQSHGYIDSLRHIEGEVLSRDREGCECREDGKIIDVYKVCVKKDGTKAILEYTIYVDMYSFPRPYIAIEDFEI